METALAPSLSAAAPAIVNTAATESVDSSPRSSCGADPVSLKPGKIRLMCSYGGHIVPRPHDKTLYYVGGDTRIVVIERHTTLSDLHDRLSKTLLQNQGFTLKYQLPDEELDSLISVSTDEDFENMVEECDRLGNSTGKRARLRLFLFPKSPSNIEQLLIETGSAKTDDWFFNALNGKTSTFSGGASDRDFSECSSINNLLGLDDDPVGKFGTGVKEGERQVEVSKIGGAVNVNPAVHSIPDSPMLDTSSSFSSSSSSPSMVSLPPIKVHVEENPRFGGVLGIEDQFQQMRVVGGGNAILPPKPEELRVFVAPAVAGAVATGLPVVVGGDYAVNRAFSDDERSEHGGRVKVQIQGQTQLAQQSIAQIQQKPVSITDLSSPESVSSEGSARDPLSRQTQALQPSAQIQTENSEITPDIKNEDSNSIKIQGKPQVQEHGYMVSSQYDQNHPSLHHAQQFVHAGNPYFPTGAMPMASYYPVYAPHQQHQPLHGQQYPFYFMSARPPQAYNLHPTYSEVAQSAHSSHPEMLPSSGVAHLSGSPSKPELPSAMHRTGAGPSPQLVQLPSGQHHPQYVGFNQIPLPSQSNAPFTYEFADPAHPQIHYTQAFPPQMASHYHTLTTAAQIPNTSAKLPAAPQP